jgi:hypothetical protein
MEQPKKQELNFVIDFDAASKAWRENKKSLGNGHYKYICCQTTKTGKKCNRVSMATLDCCKMHSKTQSINTKK